MDWQLIANIVAGGVPIVMLNSFINKQILENAMKSNWIKSMEEFVKKEDFDKHIRDHHTAK